MNWPAAEPAFAPGDLDPLSEKRGARAELLPGDAGALGATVVVDATDFVRSRQ